MPILVQLLNADGSEAGSASDPGLLDRLIDDIDDYRVLNDVDLYGDVVFDTSQMRDFLVDWRIASKWAQSPADQQFAIDVEQLAIRVRDSIDLSLRFLGD